MKKKRTREGQIVFEVDVKDKKRLQAEADAEKLTLTAYIRRLVLLHPDRRGKK